MSLYPVLQSRRLGQRPLKVIWQGTPIVLFRDETYAVCAFHDTCPHLDTSLSEGWVKDGRLVCPWHHWEFAADGSCQHPVSMGEYKCDKFPVQEAHGWIWLGLSDSLLSQDGFALSKAHLVLGKNLKDWPQTGLTECSTSHAQIEMKGLRCDIQLFTNKGITETHYRVGVWHPLQWSADPERPKIADIMASALTHLNG